MIDANKLRAELSDLGESAVALQIAQGQYSDETKAFAEHWLREQASTRKTNSAARLEREGKLLQLVRQSQVIAEQASEAAQAATHQSAAASRAARHARAVAWTAWGVTTAAIAFELWFHLTGSR